MGDIEEGTEYAERGGGSGGNNELEEGEYTDEADDPEFLEATRVADVIVRECEHSHIQDSTHRENRNHCDSSDVRGGGFSFKQKGHRRTR